MNHVQSLLSQAKNEIRFLRLGEDFIVRDLFKGYEWKRISLKERMELGRLFWDYIAENATGIVPLGKTPLDQQKYVVKR